MKKQYVSIFMSVVMLFITFVPINVNAAGVSTNDVVMDTSVLSEDQTGELVGENGEKYILYKDGLEYKVRYENGTVKTWGRDVLVSSENEPVLSLYSVEWVYSHTDKYKTHLDYEVLGPLLTLADAVSEVSKVLGVSIAVAAFVVSYRPVAYYRIDKCYRFFLDPLQMMLECSVYRNSNYTGLVDSFIKYMNFNI